MAVIFTRRADRRAIARVTVRPATAGVMLPCAWRNASGMCLLASVLYLCLLVDSLQYAAKTW